MPSMCLKKQEICELLPEQRQNPCGEITDYYDECTYVDVGVCKGHIPWTLRMRDWKAETPCQLWHRQVSSRKKACPVGMVNGPTGGWPCAALIPSRGMFLPDWYHQDYRVVSDDGRGRRCYGIGYLMRKVPECPMSWQHYIVGDPLPTRAVNVSTWKDGTPLYLVAGRFGSTMSMGYLLPSVPRTYIMSYTTYHPTDVMLLVYT